MAWGQPLSASTDCLRRPSICGTSPVRAPGGSTRPANSAGCWLAWGSTYEARRLFTELEAIDDEAWRFLLQARIAAALGEKDRAVSLIARMPMRGYLHQELQFQPLLGYPPFEELNRPRG